MIPLIASCVVFMSGADGALRSQPAPPAARTFLDFRPSLHGFLFINSFEGSPIGDIGVPGARAIATQVVGGRFGLCGGMSFAAADLFFAGVARPAQNTVPPPGSAWYQYIHARQAESVARDLSIIALFGRWMRAPDEGLTGVRVQTLAALESMRAPLLAGRGVVVGMVFPADKRGRARKLWEHHQVLAYRLEVASAEPTRTARLFIYDPNYPRRDDAVIEVHPVIAAWARTGGVTPLVPVIGARTERRVPGPTPARDDLSPLRGVFEILYTPRVPPASLFEGADARW